MGLLKVICINTYKILLRVTIFKFFQQTQHSIFLLSYYYSVDLIKMAPPSEESRAMSGGPAHVERHPPGTGELSKCRAEGLPMIARCFSPLYFTWTDLNISLPDISVSCRKGSFKKYFKNLFILVFCYFHGTFPQSHNAKSSENFITDI